MSRLSLLVVAVVALCGCRTELKPYRKPPAKEVYVGDKRCDVYDYAAATDVPDGATNLGWVSVKMEEGDDDDATFVRLREKICELGGNALSQPAWVKDPGETTPSTLKANAWTIP